MSRGYDLYVNRTGGVVHCKLCKSEIADQETCYRYHAYPATYYRCSSCQDSIRDKPSKTVEYYEAGDYTLQDIHSISKARILSWQMEKDNPYFSAIEQLRANAGKTRHDYGSSRDLPWWQTCDKPEILVAKFVQNPGQMMYALTSGKVTLPGRRRRGWRSYHDSLELQDYTQVRLPLWLLVSNELKVFLPKISGAMLERIWQRNREVMRKKHNTRAAYAAWCRQQEESGKRLAMLDQMTLASILSRKLARSRSVICKKYDYKTTGDIKGKKQYDLHVSVYFGKDGYRFSIEH